MTNKLTKSSDGMFFHNENPSPLMTKVMDNIRQQMAAEQTHRERVRAGLEPAEYDRVTFGDMVRGATDEGDFDDHFTAEDYDRRRYQRDGWGTVPGDRWV